MGSGGGVKKATLAILATVVLAAPAWATQGEHEISVGVAGNGYNGGAVGLDGRWLYDLTDFWAIGAGLHNRNWLRDGHYGSSGSATFDARFVLDALQWIPSIGAGIGAGVAGGAGYVDISVPWAHVDLGVDYRPTRKWGLGLRVGMEGALIDTKSYSWVGGVYWNWYGGTGIGLDL